MPTVSQNFAFQLSLRHTGNLIAFNRDGGVIAEHEDCYACA